MPRAFQSLALLLGCLGLLEPRFAKGLCDLALAAACLFAARVWKRTQKD